MKGKAMVIAACAVACAAPVVSLRAGSRAYTPQQYEDVLGRWTRTAQLNTLQGLDVLLDVSATYESWDFRWAYVVRYAGDFHLSTAERSRLLDASLEASTREHEFYVALYTSSRRWGELTRATSAWRVLLVDDRQHEVPPVAIEPVRRPGALERTYFPYTSVWRQAYRIRFPRTVAVPGEGDVEILNPHTRFFILRFAGPLGHIDLVWNVAG